MSGVVRDLILEIQDIDLMVEGDGILFAKKLWSKIGVKDSSVWKNSIIPNKSIQIEVASSRAEQYDLKSRSPQKIFYKFRWRSKKKRFKINAMAVDINPKRYGELYDPFNGINNLNKKILCTPLDPDKTFSDDPLRMMQPLILLQN